jgi:hypothetical protein
MEIYVLYNFITTFLDAFSRTDGVLSRWIGLGSAIPLWLILFLLQGFGLSAMAKGQGIEKRWKAFVPFVNILFIGKLAGESRIFSQKVKRAGMYAMIAQILSTITCALMIFAELYLYINVGEPTLVPVNPSQYYLDWGTISGFPRAMENLYRYGGSILSIFQLVYEILIFIMLMSLYKKYSAKNYMLFSFLSLFVPMSRYIVIFVLRNNKAIDYEALMRKKREEYLRRQQQQQQQYGNPFGNPYGNPFGNPYNNPYGNPFGGNSQNNQPKNDGDPFEEFPDDSNDKNGDGFFN